ncbi:MAG: hypothetical protein LZ167_04595 [Thaumarchaeota archaeon]|jgi:hypothetical protein|nr:hypothetical protein [Candidatus Geocrenenecus arthurdayi]
MHVLDYILDRISVLFRFNNYPLCEKAYSVMFHIDGLSFRDVSERYCVTMASKESVRRWLHRFSRIFSVEEKSRDTVERFFGYLKQRTKRFYNNINTWKKQSIEDYASAIATIRNILTIMKTKEESN